MKPILTYLAQSGLCLALFFLAYELFLKRETFFQLNRIFLVSGLWCSLLLPAFPVTSPFRTLTVPLAYGRTSLSSGPAGGFGWAGLIAVLYAAGVVVFLSRFIVQLLKLRRVVREHGIRRLRGVKIVAVDRLFSPFSFFDIVFLNSGPSPDADFRRILAHEQVHIRQQHTLDVLLMEVVLSFQWFNPFVWPYKKALQETHEYLADAGVIARGFSPVRYQLHMFEQNVGASLFEFGNNFKKSQIKRRIIMLSKMKSPGPARLKLLVALPLVAGLILAFAQPRLVAGPAPDPGASFAQDRSEAKDLQAKEMQAGEEMKKLQAIAADLKQRLEAASDETEIKDLKAKLEKVLMMEKDLAAKNGGKADLSPEMTKKMVVELRAKQKEIRAAYEKASDEGEKAELKAELAKLYEKEQSLKATPFKASESSGRTAEEMKKNLVELKAMQADLKARLEASRDPEQKDALEAKLKEIQAKTAAVAAEFEKAAAEKKIKADKKLG